MAPPRRRVRVRPAKSGASVTLTKGDVTVDAASILARLQHLGGELANRFQHGKARRCRTLGIERGNALDKACRRQDGDSVEVALARQLVAA